MPAIASFVLKVKRAETPFYRSIKQAVRRAERLRVPVPRIIMPALRIVYDLHFLAFRIARKLIGMCYSEPLFRSRCTSVGKGLYLHKLPAISAGMEVRFGDDVRISGALRITAGRVFDRPRLVVGNKVYLAHQVTFDVAREITIEDGAWLAAGTSVSDNDGHPLDLDSRLAGLPPRPEEVKPVRICRNAWIGRGCRIMKGVTIGEGAVVGAGSVVLSDVPPFALALGYPARVIRVLSPAPNQPQTLADVAAGHK